MTGCKCVSLPELYLVVENCQEFFYEVCGGGFLQKCQFAEI